MSTLEQRPYFTRTRLIRFAVGMVVGGSPATASATWRSGNAPTS